MAGDPHQCRLNAARCLALAQRAWRPDAREAFTDLAETWKKLAAETESDQALLSAISEMELGEPYEALPRSETSLMGGVVTFSLIRSHFGHLVEGQRLWHGLRRETPMPT